MVAWISALARTRNAIAGALRRALRLDRPDPAVFEELEETLVRADVAPRFAAELIEQLEQAYRGLQVSVALIVGVNGSGKTTGSAKLARRARAEGRVPLLGAGDTFRAAGSDQLRWWAERVPCGVVAGATGADAASVAYDAVEAAIARSADLLIFDTAGRMHTRQPLMEELGKVRRAMGNRLPRAPDDTWIVLDAALGRNAIAQARSFHEATPLTGVIISKLDGSAKAGFVFSIAEELNLPVLYAGLGEGPDDLAPFAPELA